MLSEFSCSYRAGSKRWFVLAGGNLIQNWRLKIKSSSERRERRRPSSVADIRRAIEVRSRGLGLYFFSKSSYSTVHFVSSDYSFDLFPDGKILGFLISLMNNFLYCDVFSSPLPKCFQYSYYHQYLYFNYSHCHYSFYYHYSYYHFLMNRPFCRTGSPQVYVATNFIEISEEVSSSAVHEDEEDRCFHKENKIKAKVLM